jgi:hypothetical protein
MSNKGSHESLRRERAASAESGTWPSRESGAGQGKPDARACPDDIWEVFNLDDVEGEDEPGYGDFWIESENEDLDG